jgi:hypothetical protein
LGFTLGPTPTDPTTPPFFLNFLTLDLVPKDETFDNKTIDLGFMIFSALGALSLTLKESYSSCFVVIQFELSEGF